MFGTLAIWRESHASSRFGEPVEPDASSGGADPVAPAAVSAKPDGSAPTVELHFNLWRDLHAKSNFIDVGIKLEPTDLIDRLLLYVPARIETGQVRDLSPLLHHGGTLNVVFNELVDIVGRATDHLDVDKAKKSFLRIHRVDVDHDLDLYPVEMERGRIGTVLAFKEAFCSRLSRSGPPHHYVRLRIDLTHATRDVFGSEITPKDWWLLSSFYPTELVEFRLNERRSLPPSIVKWFEEGPLRIERIHYFLIRDVRHQLMVQHKDFSKIRMLEDELWQHYLRGRHPEDSSDTRPSRSLRRDRLVIYHWKESELKRPPNTDRSDDGKASDPAGIYDFNAFAKFQSPRSRILLYAAVIVLLGATGSALQATSLAWLSTGPMGETGQPSPKAQFWTMAVLAAIVFALPVLALVIRWSRSILRRAFEWSIRRSIKLSRDTWRRYR